MDQNDFLFMTDDATYAYGNVICEWLSLEHDPKRPQQIDILNGKKIIQVESGNEFVVVLTDDGLVYLASSDDSEWQTYNTLQLITTGNDHFEMIACGFGHLLLLRTDGTVFALGRNSQGQLTGNLKASYNELVDTGLNNVEIIACGVSHCLALTNADELYSWGNNYDGQLGLGDNKNRKTPSLVSLPDGLIDSPIKNIVAGGWHSLLLLEDGQIFGWGYCQRPINDNQQDSNVPTKIPIENVQSVACKNCNVFSLALCYLKMASKYYNQMFSGDWKENKLVTIKDYNYDVYYSYLMMLHNFHIKINKFNIVELIDLANCYDDERLMENCKTFIQRDLNRKNLFTYLPSIIKYKLFEYNPIHIKLVKLIIDKMLPKIIDKAPENIKNIAKFLE
uniref:RCC1 and BTB domain-containing protein 2-like n=1 Tax=Dermatophagoides pteronyssinus TaxID=6956 RepID=A0A6P6YFK1_DERPT